MICDGSRLMRYPRSVVLFALLSACHRSPPCCMRLPTVHCPEMLLENHFMLLLLSQFSLSSFFPSATVAVFARRWCFVRYRCSLACRRFLRLPSKLFLLVVVVVLASRFGRFSLCASACSRRGSCGAWSAFCWSVFIVAAGWLLMVVAGCCAPCSRCAVFLQGVIV